MTNAATLEAEYEAFAARMDADHAEYDFNRYCNAGPGVKASVILASMEGDRNKAFWNAAMYSAMGARAAWLAA